VTRIRNNTALKCGRPPYWSRFGYISTSDCLKLCDDTMMCANATKQNNTQDLDQDCLTVSFPVQWMFAAVLVDRDRPQPFCLSISPVPPIHTNILRFNGHFPGEPDCPLILLLHIFLDCASFWHRPKLSMSFLTQSHQVFFGHPLCLIPSTSDVIQRLTQ